MTRHAQAGLIEGLLKKVATGNAAAAVRAARDLRRMTEQDATVLYEVRKSVIREAMRATEVRVRWNLIIVLGRLALTGNDRAGVVDWLFERLGDDSGLVRTMALQALFDLSTVEPALRSRAMFFAEQFVESGTPAMRARARRLLKNADRHAERR